MDLTLRAWKLRQRKMTGVSSSMEVRLGFPMRLLRELHYFWLLGINLSLPETFLLFGPTANGTIAYEGLSWTRLVRTEINALYLSEI